MRADDYPEGEVPTGLSLGESSPAAEDIYEMTDGEVEEEPLVVERVNKEPLVAKPIDAPPGAEIVEEAEPKPAPSLAQRAKRSRKRERKVGAVLDYWEPVPGRSAWVRHHVWSRKQLFVPTAVGANGDGPDPADLDEVRITQYTLKGGLKDSVRDNWKADGANRLLEDSWVGETWFFLKGKAPSSPPTRRSVRHIGKQKPITDMPEPPVMQKLVGGAGKNREGLLSDLGPLEIERVRLAAAQRADPDFGEVMVALLCEEKEMSAADTRRAIADFRNQSGGDSVRGSIDGVLEFAKEFELVRGLLFKHVFDAVEHEVQLRLCVPDQTHSKFEYPGQSHRSLGYRERLILEYHNGPLAGHIGRERTYELMAKDYWWPGMYESIRRWCRNCETCIRERGISGVTSFSRTQYYSRPFRVLQYDTVECNNPRDEEGKKYILTVICCFSRWPWLIVIPRKDAKVIAEALFYHVLLGMSIFPVVLRSDNAREFTSEVNKELNRLLGITHITGTAYHPQSQGMVERMHRTLNGLMRCLVQGRPNEWEMMIPFAQCILRMVSMKVLNGRSPFEVVLGFRPRLPSSLVSQLPVEEISTDEYVARLGKYFAELHSEITKQFSEHEEDLSGRGKGKQSSELKIGDLVLVRRNPSTRREGALRFQERVWPDIYRIVRGSHPVFHLTCVGDQTKAPPMKMPVNAANLIKVDMPEFDIDPNQPRELEIQEDPSDPEAGWVRYRIEKFAVDGTVLLRNHEHRNRIKWSDLSKCRYRWVM